MTGEVDYITDGERTVAVEGGTAMLTRVVGHRLRTLGGRRCLLCATGRPSGECRNGLLADEAGGRTGADHLPWPRQFRQRVAG